MLNTSSDTSTAINKNILFIDDNENIINDYYKILANPSSATENNDRYRELEERLFDIEQADDDKTSDGAAEKGYFLASAMQGEEGLEIMRSFKRDTNQEFAVAFIDMRMPPGWSGLETILRIRSEFPHTEVVLCTAFSDASHQDIISMLGKSSTIFVLKKPFDSIEIIHLAENLSIKWNDALEHRILIKQLKELNENKD